MSLCVLNRHAATRRAETKLIKVTIGSREFSHRRRMLAFGRYPLVLLSRALDPIACVAGFAVRRRHEMTNLEGAGRQRSKHVLVKLNYLTNPKLMRHPSPHRLRSETCPRRPACLCPCGH